MLSKWYRCPSLTLKKFKPFGFSSLSNDLYFYHFPNFLMDCDLYFTQLTKWINKVSTNLKPKHISFNNSFTVILDYTVKI